MATKKYRTNIMRAYRIRDSGKTHTLSALATSKATVTTHRRVHLLFCDRAAGGGVPVPDVTVPGTRHFHAEKYGSTYVFRDDHHEDDEQEQ